jgi:hypothetical protein
MQGTFLTRGSAITVSAPDRAGGRACISRSGPACVWRDFPGHGRCSGRTSDYRCGKDRPHRRCHDRAGCRRGPGLWRRGRSGSASCSPAAGSEEHEEDEDRDVPFHTPAWDGNGVKGSGTRKRCGAYLYPPVLLTGGTRFIGQTSAPFMSPIAHEYRSRIVRGSSVSGMGTNPSEA